ncbi:MAG: hypothetical protein Q7U73_11515 [Rubrivivax sp.]|nr:hypothetical protein [Rubrivivax sp.]
MTLVTFLEERAGRAGTHALPIFLALLVLLLLALWGGDRALHLGRCFLGGLFASDVVAGFASGAAWLALCITGIEVARSQKWRSGA